MNVKVTVFVPKNIFLTNEMVAEMARVQNSKTAPEVKKLFRQTVNGWEHDVSFGSLHRTTPNYIATYIFPTGGNKDLYALVSMGAKPHPIPTSGTTRMVFQPGYTASTRPHSIISSGKKRSGNFITAYKINHPGFKGRMFNQTIKVLYGGIFYRDMVNVIKRQAAKAASPSNQETL